MSRWKKCFVLVELTMYVKVEKMLCLVELAMHVKVKKVLCFDRADYICQGGKSALF